MSTQALTYYTCPSGRNTSYLETLDLITDRNCPFEDRVLQCELEGGIVSSDIQGNTKHTFDPVFLRVRDDATVSKNFSGLLTM